MAWENDDDYTLPGIDKTGVVPRNVVYTPEDTDNYNVVNIPTTLNVLSSAYTIRYHGNGSNDAGIKGSVEEYTQTAYAYTGEGGITEAVTLDANNFRKSTGGYLYSFGNWSTQSNGSGTSYSDKATVAADDALIANIKPGETINLYAVNWSKDSTGGYWFNTTAKASNPESNPARNQSQIDEDMKLLHGTLTDANGNKLTTNSEGNSASAVEGIYQGYLSNEVHLYTKWYGSTTDSSGSYSANNWVEFRIIQVGQHDGDGSALTFMATHSLPEAKRMNDSSDTNSGGWYSSSLRSAMSSYVAYYLSDLASEVRNTDKITAYRASTSGSWSTAATNSKTSDKFWLLSYSEVTGTTHSPNYPYMEGSMYSWFSGRITNTTGSGSNPDIAGFASTRAGNSPRLKDGETWWTRTPEASSKDSFCRINQDGTISVGYYNNARYYRGVVPCFTV